MQRKWTNSMLHCKRVNQIYHVNNIKFGNQLLNLNQFILNINYKFAYLNILEANKYKRNKRVNCKGMLYAFADELPVGTVVVAFVLGVVPESVEEPTESEKQ